MPITGTAIKKFGIWAVVILLAGCPQKSAVEEAREYVQKSGAYYAEAVSAYKGLIAKGKDTQKLRLELGKLYYAHGEFKKAGEELQAVNLPDAKKFLALSFYHLGDFTDALEIFNKNEFKDNEYLYYGGLTREKLNLFDKALAMYKKITPSEFSRLAGERIDVIEKLTGRVMIKDADPEVAGIIAKAPPADTYPQAGALILLADEKFKITPRDTEVSDLHYVIKILNERGKESFSESQIEYDSTSEKVELEFARTIKPDGTVVEVGSRHIRDVSKYLNFPLYSNARVFIISFPEITEGAVIEYKCKITRNELINKKDFVLNYPVQSSEPVIAAHFRVEVPVDKDAHIKVLNGGNNDFAAGLQPQVTEESGSRIYDWNFKEIPQIIPESNMPPQAEINPTIVISSFSSWDEIYAWWWKLAREKISPSEEIRQKVKELIAGKQSDEERVRSIYNFCAKEIRYVAVEYGEAGYEPHQAEAIFKNKYGDCKDQAVLLVTMLKDAGFSAWPVLIPTKDYYNLNQDFPSVIFDHCIAALSHNGKMVFLDPTAETCSFGDLPAPDQNRRVLVFKEDTFAIEETPLYPAAHNVSRQNIRIKINDDESIEAAKEVLTSGVYEQGERYWLLYTPPDLIEQALKEKIQEVSIGSQLKEYKIDNADDLDKAIVLRYTFSGPEYLTTAGALRLMPQLSYADISLAARDKRKYALDFDFLGGWETAVDIAIPKNFSVRYIPENVREDAPWFTFDVAYLYSDNVIHFTQRFALKRAQVSRDEYPAFKDTLEHLAKKIKQRIVLEKAK
jgi:cellulose synthase operon protein C